MYHTLSYSKLFVTPGRTRTCIHLLVSRLPPDMCLFCIQPLAVRESVIPHCWITYITHLPKSLGATLPFVHQVIWSGRQDSNLRPLVRSVYKIRTYDTSFIIQTHQFLSLLVNCNQNQCSSQLNYFPKCVVFYNTSDYHQFFKLIFSSTQQNRTAIPRMKILWPDR